MKDKILNFFKNKTIGYYVGLGAAVLMIITSFIYLGVISNINEYLNYGVFFFILLSGLVYIALSSFNFDKLASGSMATCAFGSFVTYILTVFDYPLAQLMDYSFGDIPHIMGIIVIAAILLICAITSNVLMYMKLNKIEKNEENKTVTEVIGD